MINLKDLFKVNNLKEKGRNVDNSFEYTSGQKSSSSDRLVKYRKIVDKAK